MDTHTTSWAAAALTYAIAYFAGAFSALLLVGLWAALKRARTEEES